MVSLIKMIGKFKKEYFFAIYYQDILFIFLI